MASMVRRLLAWFRAVWPREREPWVQPSNAITRWLNGSLEPSVEREAKPPHEGMGATASGEEREASATDAA